MLFGNDQQFKAGLDAAEVNQRAVALVIEDLVVRSYDPEYNIIKKDLTVDWECYYGRAEAAMKAEKLSQYKVTLHHLAQKADMIEGMLPKFEERVKEELRNEPAKGDKAKSAEKFLNDVRAQIVRVRKVKEAIEVPGTEVQIQEFDDTDTFFNYVLGMNHRMEAEEKKKAEAKAESQDSEGTPVIVSASEDNVRVFGE